MRATSLLMMLLIVSPDACMLETVIFGEGEVIPADTWYPAYGYSGYPGPFNNPWVGRSRDELIEALGPPEFVYEARPRFSDYWKDGFPAYMYVYRSDTDASGRCVDAYVVAQPTATVIRYRCR